MSRPTIATTSDVRSTVLTLLLEAGADESPSEQSFRRAVSVRKVRARLGGGNPSTIGREINAVEAELVRGGMATLAIPDLPADIAVLMAQLWQAAVGVQLDEVLALKSQAQGVADGARNALAEAQLRGEVLMQELVELRVAIADRDTRLAQALATQAALEAQSEVQNAELLASHGRESQLRAELATQEQSMTAAVATARDRYDGLSKQLLQETEQQRQAAQVEIGRMAGQLKFAEKREATQLSRIAHVETELQEVRAQRDQALGEVSALKYVNTALRTQVDGILSAIPKPHVGVAPKTANLAKGRKRTAKPTSTASSAKRTKPDALS